MGRDLHPGRWFRHGRRGEGKLSLTVQGNFDVFPLPTQSSGLSTVIGDRIGQLDQYMSSFFLILSLCVITNVLIEFMRTSATASILMPVTIRLSEKLNWNALKLMIPANIACAYAFISPIGTTANTITYYHANLSITDMVSPRKRPLEMN